METVKAFLPYDIDSLVVPAEKVDAFLEIARKPQRFFAGCDRSYYCAGKQYYVHTSYDAELQKAGLLPTEWRLATE